MKDNEYSRLPSGTQVIRNFDRNGIMVEEIWSNERLGISMSFRDGRKSSESYFWNDRLVGRKKYERERANYPDMPAADQSLRDWGAAALRDVAEERRERARAAKSHIPDPAKGASSTISASGWQRKAETRTRATG